MKICPRCSELFPDDAGFCPYDGVQLDKSADKYLGRTIASRYRLIKRLGSGGMSSVYLARHIIIDRLSALKILRKELSLNPSHRERFLREARAVNRINHRNIVEISDVGEADGVAYLVMEYVQGESLHVHIQRGRLEWQRAARITVQIASALARAHQMGIIHRDLKPENVLIIRDDEGKDIVKLTDFGIAKILDMPSLTFSEQLFGTPGYIAPEYVEGIAVDERADVYSLGVVFYEMLTGLLPYEWQGQADLLLKPLTSAPIPPSRRIGPLPPGLEALVLSMIARRADDRPGDAFAIHDALVELLRRSGSISWSSLPAIAVVSDRRPRVESRAPEATIVEESPPFHPSAGSVRSSQPPAVPLRSSFAVAPGGAEDGIPRFEHVQVPDQVLLPHLETPQMATRWAAALAELETRIGSARRRGGEWNGRANQAAELAQMADEMIPRVERSTRVVADIQARVDRIQARGREFQGNLGHAIDVLLRDRSRERAHLEAVKGRRDSVYGAGARYAASSTPADDAPGGSAWESAALEIESDRVNRIVADLTFQIEALQEQLDARNDELERELMEATGALEGSLAALRRMSSELARTLREGIALLG